jgi:hypothetical protein
MSRLQLTRPTTQVGKSQSNVETSHTTKVAIEFGGINDSSAWWLQLLKVKYLCFCRDGDYESHALNIWATPPRAGNL